MFGLNLMESFKDHMMRNVTLTSPYCLWRALCGQVRHHFKPQSEHRPKAALRLKPHLRKQVKVKVKAQQVCTVFFSHCKLQLGLRDSKQKHPIIPSV